MRRGGGARVGAAALLLAVGFACGESYEARVRSRREHLQATADLAAIRGWIRERASAGEMPPPGVGVDPSEWPDAVKDLKPRVVEGFSADAVRLIWRSPSGDERWGVIVAVNGSTTVPPVPGETWVALRPGAVFFHSRLER
jgi:hypothetical protein